MPTINLYLDSAAADVRAAILNVANAAGRCIVGRRPKNAYQLDSILSDLADWLTQIEAPDDDPAEPSQVTD